ncbi:hypothetical protein D5086_019613 [Populus alba]|uniref:Uncharacterized protein n=1 Tax=Populus alba TaxID=43335 RepID=A0ACC4BJ64_POPAL
MRNTQNPEVFLDISIGGNLAERIGIELLADQVPKTAQNFLALCAGTIYQTQVPVDMGLGKHTGKPMYLKGSTFYNIVRGKWAEGGDFSEENGTGGENIFWKHVVFGRVVRGYETVQKIEQVQTFPDGRPEHLVIITACGVSPKTRSLNSILIRKGIAFAEFSKQFGILMLFFPEKNQYDLPCQIPVCLLKEDIREKESKKDTRVVEHHSKSRNYEGDGNSAKESVPRHSRSKLRDKTSQGSRWPSPIQRSDSKHSPRRRNRSNSRDRTGHQWYSIFIIYCDYDGSHFLLVVK